MSAELKPTVTVSPSARPQAALPTLGMVRGIYAFWRRNALVWRSNWIAACFAFVLDPAVFLFAFGYGLGAAFTTMSGMPYFAFVVPGMMGLGLLYTSFIECSYAAFFRMEAQRTYHAILATPMALGHIVAGEILWAGTKATLSSSFILLVGACFGGVLTGWHSLLAIPVATLTAMAVGAMALLLTSVSRRIDDFNYAWPLLVTPMLMFSGTFIELARFPVWVQMVGKCLPLYHGVEVMRMLTSGHNLVLETVWAHIAYLVAIIIVFGALALARLNGRIFK